MRENKHAVKKKKDFVTGAGANEFNRQSVIYYSCHFYLCILDFHPNIYRVVGSS